MAKADDPTTSRWPFVGREAELEVMVASLEDSAITGVVVHGRPGVGKTRLAEECLTVAQAAGFWCVRSVASERTRQVPLGAIAHLLPARILLERSEPATLFPKVAATVKARGGGRRVIALVDDVHLLDSTSAILLGQLLDAGLNFLVGTVRTGEAVPAGVSALWRNDRVRRVDIDELSPAAFGAILETWLGGTVAHDTIETVWESSEGNALFAREMVLGALEGGRLHLDRGVWRLVGPLHATARLTDAVTSRLEVLDQLGRAALDRVAVWEPVGLAMLNDAVGASVVEELERLGFIRVRTGERRQEVTVAHPLYGEILRRELPATTRRRLLLDLIGEVQRRGSRRREDPVTLAIAYLDATGSANAELLTAAAWLARYNHDHVQVERLARAASTDGVTPETGLLLGEALHELSRYEEAGDAFTSALGQLSDDSPEDSRVFTLLVEMHVRNLMWGLHRPDEAMDVLHAMRLRTHDQTGRQEFLAEEAMILSYTGRPLESLEVIGTIGDDSSDRTRVIAAIAAEPALLAVGRCDEVAEVSRRAFGDHARLGDHAGLPGPGVHLIFQCHALTNAGRIAESSVLAEACIRQIPRYSPPSAALWFVVALGRNSMLAGKLGAARRWFTDAVARCEGDLGPRRVVLSLLATAAASMGDVEAARSAVLELEGIQPFAYSPGEQLLGSAWLSAANGSLARAAEELVSSARDVGASGHSFMEAWLLHDACRLGQHGTSTRLAELAATGQGALVLAWSAHARAVDAGDPSALADASSRFEGLGMQLFAAEAATEAAHAFQRAGRQREAANQGARAAELVAACESPRTPALVTTESPVPLTDRELEICLLAAEGASGPAIAARLYVSVRTVNNHLQRAYAKLGVRNRTELAEALARVARG
jgi:DNA-binding CsgD family transcriptional regulator